MSYGTLPRPKRGSSGDWAEVVDDIYNGVTVGTSHSVWFVKNKILQIFGLAGKAKATPSDAGDNETQGLRVIGVGYGRTGTYSLTLALTELGFPCLHTQHLYESPDILEMWAKEVFIPSLKAGEAIMGTPDFDLVASNGWRATMDLPMALYYEQILEKYPDCKFILTTRENSEVWFRSWNMLMKTITQPTQHFAFLSHIRIIDKYFRWLLSVINRDNKYLTAPYPFPDQIKEEAITSYEEHNQRVREIIPPGQLLEYSVKEGWEPLCQFLEVNNCPNSHFPMTNSARSVQIQTVSAMIVPLAVSVFIVFYLFSYGFQMVTGRTILQWANLKRRMFLAVLTGKERKRQERMATKTHILKMA